MPKVTILELKSRLEALASENQRILLALVTTNTELDKLSTQVDSLKEIILLLSKDAQSIYNFYVSLKKQEQEIFWKDIRKPSKDSDSRNPNL